MLSLRHILFGEWTTKDDSGRKVPLYEGIYAGSGTRYKADGVSPEERERVHISCIGDLARRAFLGIILGMGLSFCASWATQFIVPKYSVPPMVSASGSIFLAACVIVRLRLHRPSAATFVSAMLDINRCPSCAYTLPGSAKCAEPVQCSECGSHWRSRS